VELPISPKYNDGEGDGWEVISDAAPPTSFVRQCLDEAGIPYEVNEGALPGQVGTGISFKMEDRDEMVSVMAKIEELWCQANEAEGWEDKS
jgi:hypothetical protein